MTALFHAYTQTVADGTATSVVRPSDWNSAHIQAQTLSGNVAGQTAISGTNIVFQGGNNVTLSGQTAGSAATIVFNGATFAQTQQPMYFSASGSNTSANTMQFGDTNGVSFSLSNGSVVATVATNYMASNQSSNFVNTSQSSLFQQTSATSAITSAALNTSQSSLFQQTSATSAITSAAFPSANTTKFAGTGFTSTTTAGTAVVATQGTNGLSMAVPAFITTYVNDLTSGRAGTGYTSTTTAGTAVVGTLNTNGLSLGVPAYITTYVNDLTSGRAGTGYTSTTTAGTAVVGTLNTNGLSLGVPAYITTYVNDLTSGRAGTGFTSTTTAGTAVVGTLNTNGLSIGVPAYITTYVAQTVQTQNLHNVTLSGNTSGTLAQVSSGTLTLAGGNNITLSQVGNAITISGVNTVAQTVDTNKAGTGYTSTTQAGSTVGVTLNTSGLSAAWPPFITTYAAQTVDTNKAGTGYTSTTQAGSTVGVTLNTSGLSAAWPPFITTYAAQTVDTNKAGTGFTSTTTAGTAVVGTLNTNGLSLGVPAYITTYVNDLTSGRAGTGTTFGGTNISGSMTLDTNGLALSLSGPAAPLLSRVIVPNYAGLTMLSAPTNASASVNVVTLPYLSGTRMDLLLYQSLASSATANTYGQQLSIYMGIYTNDTLNSRLMSLSSGSTQTTYTVASNTAGATQILGSGIRPISCPVNFSVTPGEYFIAANLVTNTFSSGTATTALGQTLSIVGNLMQSASWAIVPDYTVATAATNNRLQPAGVFSAASTGLPATISYSQMTMTGASRLQANFAVVMRNN